MKYYLYKVFLNENDSGGDYSSYELRRSFCLDANYIHRFARHRRTENRFPLFAFNSMNAAVEYVSDKINKYPYYKTIADRTSILKIETDKFIMPPDYVPDSTNVALFKSFWQYWFKDFKDPREAFENLIQVPRGTVLVFELKPVFVVHDNCNFLIASDKGK